MKWRLANPICFSETGKRKNNQDSLYPTADAETIVDGLYMVCDGMGGASNGEVASKLACLCLSDWFASNPVAVVDEQQMNDAFTYMRHRFNEYVVYHPDAMDMGTTMVLAKVHEKGVSVAHCGDSRFYHFRQNSCLFKTFDHTPVNDLIRNGIIKQEDASMYPRSNAISRAIQASPHKFCVADVAHLTNIEPGDVLMLCSDGVWSCFTTKELIELFSSPMLLEEKAEIIKKICEANSKDNYTAILLNVLPI
jgi:protein phosphatase